MSRRVLAGLWAMAPLAVALVLLTALPAPDRVPTHWSGRDPDGWSTGGGLSGTVLTVVALAAITAALAAVLRRAVPEAWSRWLVTAAAAVGWGAVAVYALTVWRTGVDGPERVREVWGLLGVAVGLLAGVVGYAVHGRTVPAPAALRDRIPERARVVPLRGRPGEVQPWHSDVASTTLRVVGAGVLGVFAVLAVIMVAGGETLLLAGLVLAVGAATGLVALAWSRIRVVVDADGLSVRSRLLPVRLSRIDADEVAGVEVLDLDPMRWGGVGLRALPDRTAYIADSSGGPGIVVWRRDGRRLALQLTEGEEQARAGARALLEAAGRRAGQRAEDSSGS